MLPKHTVDMFDGTARAVITGATAHVSVRAESSASLLVKAANLVRAVSGQESWVDTLVECSAFTSRAAEVRRYSFYSPSLKPRPNGKDDSHQRSFYLDVPRV